jgi:catechol 2,3-dioxygenase-like lactoylglutathione lyase family enzyme
MVHVERATPCLLVDDVIDTAEYYRDVLGFSFAGIFGNPPGFVIVDRDGARLMFRRSPSDTPRRNSNSDAIPDFMDVYIYADDVDALAAELRTKGADIVLEPTDRPIYNGREMAVRDCNGWTLCFGQLLDDPDA